MEKSILISLDVEEFDLPREYGTDLSDSESLSVSLEGIKRVIELFDSLNIKSTCFTTAYFALNTEGLIRDISKRHEIASHGYCHSNSSQNDNALAKTELEKVIGSTVYGFRQPRLKAIDQVNLINAGYAYDSSLNPIWLPGRYMNLARPRLPHTLHGLWILPISTSPIIRFPLFWLSFKNIPMQIFKAMSDWALQQDGYLNIFFHPWEFSDLSRFDLPFYIRRPSGNEMLDRLGSYLQWLSKRGSFLSCYEYITHRMNTIDH